MLLMKINNYYSWPRSFREKNWRHNCVRAVVVSNGEKVKNTLMNWQSESCGVLINCRFMCDVKCFTACCLYTPSHLWTWRWVPRYCQWHHQFASLCFFLCVFLRTLLSHHISCWLLLTSTHVGNLRLTALTAWITNSSSLYFSLDAKMKSTILC